MVTAAIARSKGYTINALTIDYNQRHRRELESASRIAESLGAARHLVLPLDLRKIGGSALTSDIDVPKDGLGSDIPVTYVPARNLVFLSLTLAWCEAIEAQDIFIGVNALDYSGYPDCRPEFISSLKKPPSWRPKPEARVQRSRSMHLFNIFQRQTLSRRHTNWNWILR